VSFATRRAAEPDGADAAAVTAMQERGAALWQTHNCASCHVEGQAAAAAYKPLVTLGTRYTVDTLANFLRTPQPPMPVFPLDDQQRRDLAVYLLKTN
jgi:mono/diheme cytochrome c family protein